MTRQESQQFAGTKSQIETELAVFLGSMFPHKGIEIRELEEEIEDRQPFWDRSKKCIGLLVVAILEPTNGMGEERVLLVKKSDTLFKKGSGKRHTYTITESDLPSLGEK